MATSEGVWKMVDGDGKKYDIDVYSLPNRALSGTSKVYEYWYDGQIVLKQPDGTFKIRDSGVILTRVL